MMRRLLIVTLTVALFSISARAEGRKRALLIGINDYSAPGTTTRRLAPGRDWPNLSGAAGDAATMAEMLAVRYGFAGATVLTDRNATRAKILGALEALARDVANGDTVVFYYAGHGSQVRNTLSDEPDGLDESLVPADSRAGAPDIRDKELRPLLNRILDRGARLTVILDNCHSGSGARGLPSGARPRGIAPDLRDVRDGASYGPRPENRGALVLAAAQDFDDAWETRDERGTMHGAFTWALLRAMRDSEPGEAAMDTFLRAQARMRSETPYQNPLLAGDANARALPLFGSGAARAARGVLASEKVRADGVVLLQGGWANGLSVGSEVRIAGDTRGTRLTIVALDGLGRAEARVTAPARMLPQSVRAGALVEIAGWAAPPGRPLRVWMPRVAASAQSLAARARRLQAAAIARGIRWIVDPTAETPTHVLRRGATSWELLGSDKRVQRAGSDAEAIAAIPRGARLFVQFPSPSPTIAAIAVGPGTDRDGIEPVQRAEDADYFLVGRYAAPQLSYAWVRPSVRLSEARTTTLPPRSAWVGSPAALRDAVVRLRRIHGWNLLDSPRDARFAYRLRIRRERDGAWAGATLIGEQRYSLLLRAHGTLPPRVAPRYVYIFSIDSHGKSTLLFPLSGSVENRFPLPSSRPAEIPLVKIEIEPPYGVDTYFLLTTSEALPNPWILAWDGVRSAAPPPRSALERLLLETGSEARAARVLTPATWSIERVICESVAPSAPPSRRGGVSDSDLLPHRGAVRPGTHTPALTTGRRRGGRRSLVRETHLAIALARPGAADARAAVRVARRPRCTRRACGARAERRGPRGIRSRAVGGALRRRALLRRSQRRAGALRDRRRGRSRVGIRARSAHRARAAAARGAGALRRAVEGELAAAPARAA
jgi:uncharacterized caspase-like protein